jgi:regulator of replication initiation timing
MINTLSRTRDELIKEIRRLHLENLHLKSILKNIKEEINTELYAHSIGLELFKRLK